MQVVEKADKKKLQFGRLWSRQKKKKKICNGCIVVVCVQAETAQNEGGNFLPTVPGIEVASP